MLERAHIALSWPRLVGIASGVFGGSLVVSSVVEAWEAASFRAHGSAGLGVKAFSETDQYEDLKSNNVPTLMIHGDADQIVPIENSGKLRAKLVKNAQLKIYEGAPHGLCTTNKDEVNNDLLEFIRQT